MAYRPTPKTKTWDILEKATNSAIRMKLIPRIEYMINVARNMSASIDITDISFLDNPILNSEQTTAYQAVMLYNDLTAKVEQEVANRTHQVIDDELADLDPEDEEAERELLRIRERLYDLEIRIAHEALESEGDRFIDDIATELSDANVHMEHMIARVVQIQELEKKDFLRANQLQPVLDAIRENVVTPLLMLQDPRLMAPVIKFAGLVTFKENKQRRTPKLTEERRRALLSLAEEGAELQEVGLMFMVPPEAGAVMAGGAGLGLAGYGVYRGVDRLLRAKESGKVDPKLKAAMDKAEKFHAMNTDPAEYTNPQHIIKANLHAAKNFRELSKQAKAAGHHAHGRHMERQSQKYLGKAHAYMGVDPDAA